MLKTLKIKLITFTQLGVMSIMRVVLYRLLMRFGYFKRTLPIKTFALEGDFFSGKEPSLVPQDRVAYEKIIEHAETLQRGSLTLFSHHTYQFQGCPDWFYDPVFDNNSHDENHWTEINEFSFEGSDVKILWEASRFCWAPTLAQAFMVTKDEKFLSTLNHWIADWCDKNPVNQGIQWKCGQETSLRLMHFMTALKLLGEDRTPQARGIEFVERHLERISPTTSYAQSQRNNHLTSEAAALFVGGAWLAQQSDLKATQKKARNYHEKGRKLLEWAAGSLIYSDGSFAQHSTVYHRVMLDTLSFCEMWGRRLALPKFSNQFYHQAKKATDWLFWFTDTVSGDAPNLGGNDGAHILNLGLDEYRDFRPSIQLASHLFYDTCILPHGAWNDQVRRFCALDIALEYTPKKRASKLFPDGGYYIYINENQDNLWFMLRLPYFKDRPAHSDALHLDLWADGENILNDSGSYSYAAGDKAIMSNLKGVAGHNTVQFDNHDQMPVLGRFLFGDWLKGTWIINDNEKENVISASYIDYLQNTHSRVIHTQGSTIQIIDKLTGQAAQASLRWHTHRWPLPNCKLEISSEDALTSDNDSTRPYSLKYLEMQNGNCIKATGALNNNKTMITTIQIDR